MFQVIHWEVYKTFKFDYTNKWYMHKPESILNVTHKILLDFEIQTDHLILARRSDLVIVIKKKKACWIVDFAVLADHRVKRKVSEKGDKYLNLDRELKNYGTWKRR